LNLNNKQQLTTPKCSNEIKVTIKITNKTYNYSNNSYILIVSDYISVYPDHDAMDK